jgi:hypothetical protein
MNHETLKEELLNKLQQVAIERGSRKSFATLKGLARFLKRCPSTPPWQGGVDENLTRSRDEYVSERYIDVPLYDHDLGIRATDIAKDKHPRRQNWRSAKPTYSPVETGHVEVIDLGAYSRRCTYRHYEYMPQYQSALRVWRSGRSAHYIREGVERYVPAPSGTRWQRDEYGVLLRRLSDGMDYHPTAEDLQARDFVGRVRRGMSENYKARAKAKRDERDRALSEALERHALRNNRRRISLRSVSKMAGNCLAGTDEYLRWLGIESRKRAVAGAVYRLAERKKLINERFVAAAKMALQAA